MNFHPIADIFPLMDGPEYKGLVSDIKQNGLRDAIITHRDGRIIDGRNRFRACSDAGVEPQFKTWAGEDSELASFVLSVNLHRRHLDTSQRAMVAARVKEHFAAEAKERQATSTGGAKPQLRENLREADKGRASDHAARTVKVSGRSVDHAAKVLKNGNSKLVEAVEKGELPVSVASQIAAFPKSEQTELMKGAVSKKRNQKKRPKLTPEEKKEQEEWGRFASISVSIDEAITLLADPGYDLSVLIEKCASTTLERMRGRIPGAMKNLEVIKKEVSRCLKQKQR